MGGGCSSSAECLFLMVKLARFNKGGGDNEDDVPCCCSAFNCCLDERGRIRAGKLFCLLSRWKLSTSND